MRNILILILMTTAGVAAADDEHRRSVAPLREGPGGAAYRAECGACHLAYPPGMLPARSWAKLLDGLADHFGQNAELDAASRAAIAAFLEENAAERGTHRLSRKVLKSAGGETPLRLSDLRFIRREHGEVDRRRFTSLAVGSVANCGACHVRAEAGSFDEDELRGGHE